MRNVYTWRYSLSVFLYFLIINFVPQKAFSQQLKIADFVIFGGVPAQPGGGVVLSSSTNVNSGSIGSYLSVQSTGNSYVGGSIHSRGRINLANSNVVAGNISSANSAGLTGTVLQVGSSATISGNVDVKGNILIGGGTVKGSVTHPAGTSYSGPAPSGGNIIGEPSIPVLPAMPSVNSFPAAGLLLINNNKVIAPGAYGKMALPGNKKITFSGTGTYIFSAIENSGTTNNFVFDFKNNPSGIFRIYVHGNINLNKINISIINGGNESRIYTETHGTGAGSATGQDAFVIANGSAGSTPSKWPGMVWAPNGSINIGSGTGSSDINGSLWSNRQILLQSGVKINFIPLVACTDPDAQAGADKLLSCTISSVTLDGNSSTPSVQYSWQSLNGGSITSGENTSSPTVSSAGTYVLTVTAEGGCSSTDTARVTFDPCIIPSTPPSTAGKVNQAIGSELNSLYLNSDTSGDLTKNLFLLANDSVYVEVISRIGQYPTLLALLQTSNYGLTDLISNGPNSLIITGKYPIDHLLKLDSLPLLIDYVRPLFPPVGNSGIAYTNGDISIHTDFVRNGYDVYGEGVRIGVLSDSYNTLAGNPAQADVANGDLPGTGNTMNSTPVSILKDYPFGRRSDEGRAMLQIIHDIAPKASLAFRTGFVSAGDFAMGIRQLQQNNCNIIVDDITFITEPFLQDGVVAKAVDEVTALGVSYFTAAGNYGNKSYEGTFNPVTAPAGMTGSAHNFGGGDIYQNISLTPGAYTLVLQWEDAIYSLGQTSTGTINDMDIYLADNNGSTLFGLNRNNTGGDPLEILSFSVTSNTSTNILITRASGSGSVRFKYVIFRGEPTINEFKIGNSTIVGQANAAGAMTVGAVKYTNTPAFGGVLSMASFSSTGGTAINGISRNKPDFAAPNGVNTTVDLTGGNTDLNIDGDNFPNFFGTSAAAPHAAAAAALLLNARKKYSGIDMTPGQVRAMLSGTAIDIEPAGLDAASGSGFIQPNAAVRTFASPKPSITELILPSLDLIPGTVAFTVTVKGEFLDPSTQIFFRDQALATTFVSTTELKAMIPAFGSGNPPIYAYTAPTSDLHTDGGTSDTLYFFAIIKKKIVITADNKVKKYGEAMPEFTATVLVDSVPLQNTAYTLVDLGLSNIQFSSPATNLSNVNNYIIKPFIDPLDPTNPADISLLESNTYTFQSGILSIQKLPLKITPKDTTLTYGMGIGNFTFRYEYDDGAVALNDKSILKSSLSSEHQQNLANAIALVDAKALVNGRPLTDDDLESLSFLVSSRALINSRQLINAKQLVNNVPVSTTIVDVAVESIFDYQQDSVNSTLISAKQLVNAKALINARALINGTATVNARSLINGSPIVNSSTVDASGSEVVVIIDSLDFTAPPGDVLSDFKSINLVTGTNAGQFTIVPGALLSNNFEITYGLGKLTILQAPLSVKADDKVIFKGSPLPPYTSQITGYQFTDSLTVSSGPLYTLNPTYTGEAGLYAIIPSGLTFNPVNSSYDVKYLQGTLYVNPKGPGARKIKPSLDCVEVLTTNVSGFKYLAHFSYENANPTAVFVPIGPDNNLKGSGTFSGQPPVVFLPGGGKFNVYFDGSKLTWTVKTYEVNQKSSVATEASSTSSRCNFDAITSTLLQTTVVTDEMRRNHTSQSPISDSFSSNQVVLYPNPVKDMVMIKWNNISEKGVLVTDMNGKVYSLKQVNKTSTDSIELDLSDLQPGMYLIKVKGEINSKVLRVIKM